MEQDSEKRTYEQGRADQAKFTVNELLRRGLSMRFMSKVTGYDLEVVEKWCYEIDYEEGIRIGKLEESKKISRNLFEMGWAIEKIAELMKQNVKTISEWVREPEIT